MAPIVLFWQLTAPLVRRSIPTKEVAAVWSLVKRIEPVPEAAPMVLPVTVPISATVGDSMRITMKSAAALLAQLKFLIVLP